MAIANGYSKEVKATWNNEPNKDKMVDISYMSFDEAYHEAHNWPSYDQLKETNVKLNRKISELSAPTQQAVMVAQRDLRYAQELITDLMDRLDRSQQSDTKRNLQYWDLFDEFAKFKQKNAFMQASYWAWVLLAAGMTCMFLDQYFGGAHNVLTIFGLH